MLDIIDAVVDALWSTCELSPSTYPVARHHQIIESSNRKRAAAPTDNLWAIPGADAALWWVRRSRLQSAGSPSPSSHRHGPGQRQYYRIMWTCGYGSSWVCKARGASQLYLKLKTTLSRASDAMRTVTEPIQSWTHATHSCQPPGNITRNAPSQSINV